MKVWVRFEVDEEIRRIIRERNGGKGLATRQEIREEIDAVVGAHWEDLD
jgi:hypothetical protein